MGSDPAAAVPGPAAVSGAATLIALLLASSLALSGCVRDTYDCEPDGTSVSRTAFLWPTKLESAEFWVGTNKVFRLGNYASDGGQEAAASVAAAVTHKSRPTTTA